MTQLMEPTRTGRHARSGRSRLRVVPDIDDGRSPRRRQVPRRRGSSPRRQVSLHQQLPLQRRIALRRRIVPALAIAVIILAYVYATTPFTFAGAVECRPNGVAGATPAPGTPAGIVIGDPAKRCAEAGGSRLATAGVTALLAAVVGVAGAVAPSRAELDARRAAPPEGGQRASSNGRRAATT